MKYQVNIASRERQVLFKVFTAFYMCFQGNWEVTKLQRNIYEYAWGSEGIWADVKFDRHHNFHTFNSEVNNTIEVPQVV